MQVETKATINKGNIRAWRQVRQCPHQIANRRYDIAYNVLNGVPVVRIDWNENGIKKVSDTARGATIDLVNKSMTRLFGLEVNTFIWDFDEQGITVTAK